MSSVTENNFAAPNGDVEFLENCSLTELLSVLESVDFFEAQKIVEALQTAWDTAEQLRGENAWFKFQLERLRWKKSCLEAELRKCRARSRDARVVAERRGIAEDVDYALTERVRRGGGGGGGGEASLKKIFDELEGQDREQNLRVWVQKPEDWTRGS